MENGLDEINLNETDILQRLKDSSRTILRSILSLKNFIVNYEFVDIIDEINFFKNIKPKFSSKLIFYQKAYEIQLYLPIGQLPDIKIYYFKEIQKIDKYLNDNKELFSYYRSNSTLIDEIYFVRKKPDSWLLLGLDDYENDLDFTTFYDHKISKIIAFDFLPEFIKESINKLEQKNESRKIILRDKGDLIWTSSKVSLVELLYALQSTGSFNNGSIGIKDLANELQSLFNVDMGNYYRAFQEIRIRKSSRTSFMDQLKTRLIKRMDDSDENPKTR
ncbi:MAG: RteC domain-containing protein [Bacteroidota bacterium]|nr:RteC domain-containing protein [Bacteroidota bacterium]